MQTHWELTSIASLRQLVHPMILHVAHSEQATHYPLTTMELLEQYVQVTPSNTAVCLHGQMFPPDVVAITRKASELQLTQPRLLQLQPGGQV